MLQHIAAFMSVQQLTHIDAVIVRVYCVLVASLMVPCVKRVIFICCYINVVLIWIRNSFPCIIVDSL
jgi:hypothetical protein